MDIKNMASIIITFIIVFTISFYIINAIWPTEKSTQSLKVMGDQYGRDISIPGQVIGTSDLFATPFFSGAGGSLVFYLFLKTVQRTTDIDKQYIDLIGVPGSFSLQITPGSSRLEVYTQNAASGGTVVEHIELQRIPEQKWVQIAILREGRRMDVIFNNKTIASQRLKYIPRVRINSLTLGATGVTGIAGNFRVAARRISIREAIAEHIATSDTRGKPYIGSTLNTNISICTGPSCSSAPSPTTTPQNTLQFWSSPYR